MISSSGNCICCCLYLFCYMSVWFTAAGRLSYFRKKFNIGIRPAQGLAKHPINTFVFVVLLVFVFVFDYLQEKLNSFFLYKNLKSSILTLPRTLIMLAPTEDVFIGIFSMILIFLILILYFILLSFYFIGRTFDI